MSYMNRWICVAAVALALAGTYIFWGPSNRKRKKGGVPGLQNFGNSCFLNAVLQALAACPTFIKWLDTTTSLIVNNESKQNCDLMKALLSVLKDLNTEGDICNAGSVIEGLRLHRWVIPHEEQDAHELFHALTTTIEEELTSVEPVLSLLDAAKLEEDVCCKGVELCSSKAFISSPKVSTLKNSSPTRGLLVSELKCKSCFSKNPARYDTFDSISLAIPTPHWGQLSLEDLLLKFISNEAVQDVKCDVCSMKNTSEDGAESPALKTTFTKQLSFGKLPKCLNIHIQRTVWLKNSLPVKCYDYVMFPEILIMDNYAHCHTKRRAESNPSRLRGGSVKTREEQDSAKLGYSRLSSLPNISVSAEEISELSQLHSQLASISSEDLHSYNFVYLLKAVIVHEGDTSSGHFITYRRGSTNSMNQNKWYCTSDAVVREVTFSEVSHSCAYMLFYERLD